MLRELGRDDWLGFLGLTIEQVPPTLILRGTRNLKTRYEAFRVLLTDVHEVGSPNGLFEDVLVGRLNGAAVGFATVYGPAMASEIAHVFGVMGTKTVVQMGVCGALADEAGLGDLVVATSAGCGEGGAVCYLTGVHSVDATPDLVRAVEDSHDGSVPLHVGPIWTTAALLAEGDEQISAWSADGFIALDMETATTYAVAEWAGMRRVSILSVFDNPRAGGHIALTEADKVDARRTGEAAAHAVVERLVSRLASGRGA